jgi:putative FmdB family regulatory protein
MAIYEYECKTHGRFELTRPMAESDELGECPECKSPSERIRFEGQSLAHQYKGLWFTNNGGYSIGDSA